MKEEEGLGMESLAEHYERLLGLDGDWQVLDVELVLEEQRVAIRLESVAGAEFCCPECGEKRSLKDHAKQREWRHMDTMQFETVMRARVPRTDCPECGVKTCAVPWADLHGRFTLMFEAFAVRVLQAASSVEQASKLLGLNWKGLHRIMERAVEGGLAKRELDEVEHVGMDEKSFGRGHDYVSVLTDIDGARVLEVSRGRDEAAANLLWSALSGEQKSNVKAVAMDMWPAFANSAGRHVPEAEIVHDRFHISKHLNEAVDKVRRQEHRALRKEGDETLTGTKQLWLFNPENLSEEKWLVFESLKELQLKTARAWAIREQFRWFWEYRYAGNARKFFKEWYQWAIRCRLEPVKKVARMLKRHLDRILSWFRHHISNGMAEGYNSRIQSIKTAARGFRNFANYRTRILFFCGKLNLLLNSTHKNVR